MEIRSVNLMRGIKVLEKDLIFRKGANAKVVRDRTKRWYTLGNGIS